MTRRRFTVGRRNWRWARSACLGLGVSLLALVVAGPRAEAADRIILRKLEVITDRTVAQFDEDGVALDNGRILTWDEIEKATVANGQPAFDAMLSELGAPLYRLRQRLTVGDYAGVAAPAEAVFPRYLARRSRSAYMVFQALMWSRLAAGQREAAVEPYLLAVECLRSVPRANEALVVPGNRQLSWDAATGLSHELLPLWFDAEAARSALPRVGAAIGTMQTPWPPGVRIYYASLAAAAGESERMQAAVSELNDPQWAVWREIVLAQAKLGTAAIAEHEAALESALPAERGMARALALYLIGRGTLERGGPDQQREAMLKLLRIPAVYGAEHPELSAAALYDTMQVLTRLEDLPASIAVRGELLEKFATTHYANRVRKEAEQR